jgi:hypothetical protein
MARVRASRQGFDGKVIREPGEEFDFEGPLGSWMETMDSTGLTKRDIIDKLNALGIGFNVRDAKDVLEKLLSDALMGTQNQQ